MFDFSQSNAPYDAKDELVAKYRKLADSKNPQRNPVYAAMVESLDDGVGRVLAAIEECGLASDKLKLYNLKDDIGEGKNLANEKPEIVAELNSLITGFLAETQAVVPVLNPSYNLSAAKGPRGKK